jgi:deferrochelatase/peroxidase EfeB
MDDFETLHELVAKDPEQAWPLVLAYIREHPDLASAQDLVEDFIYEHDNRFVDRIEAAARQEPVVRNVVEQAYVGGFATLGAERFQRLQERLRELED